MKIFISWYKSIRMGMLSTLSMLNGKQRIHLIWLFITGKTTKEFNLKGGVKYPDKTFFIIRRDNSKVGLFSMYITNAGHIKYALDKGYVPVIDMQHYRNCYLEDNELGMRNAWEFYFKQPSEFSLEEAYSGKNIIVSNIGACNMRPNDEMSYFNNENGLLDEWRKIANNCIVIKDDIWAEAKNNFYKKTNGDKCIGVSIRGTDYVKLEPPKHPIQPQVEQVITDAEKMMVDQKAKYLYLCTEDSNIVDCFRHKFGNACFINERKLTTYTEGSIILNKLNEKINRYEDGKQYLVTMLMLSFADDLIASRASGTVAMEMISKGWEMQLIYDLGRYPEKENRKR